MSCDGNCYFGVCGFSRTPCEIVNYNIGSAHYQVCEKHRVFWHIGSNLFSAWREETEEDWERSREMLGKMTLVQEVHCDECRAKGEEDIARELENPTTEMPF